MSDVSAASLSWNDFMKVDIRTAIIIKAEPFPEAHNPSYKLQLDFGILGVKKTSAQITKLYTCEELIGKQVIAVVNFPPKQIANIMSECLILGAMGENGEITLISPDRETGKGLRIG